MKLSFAYRMGLTAAGIAAIYLSFCLGKISAPRAPSAIPINSKLTDIAQRAAATPAPPMSMPQLAELCRAHPELTRRLYQLWGRVSPLTALQAALALPEGQREGATVGALGGWGQTDAAAAWRWLAGKTLSERLPRGIKASEAAAAILAGQTSHADSDELYRTFRWERLETPMLAGAPPWERKTVKLDPASFTTGSAQFQRLALFVQGGARSDGLTVVDWIADQSFEPEAKAQLLDIAAKNWLRQPVGSEQILLWAQQSSGPETDRAKSTIAATIGSDNALTLPLLRSISQEGIRTSAVFRAATASLPQMDASRMDWVREASQSLSPAVSIEAVNYTFVQWCSRDEVAARNYYRELQARDPSAAAKLAPSAARIGG